MVHRLLWRTVSGMLKAQHRHEGRTWEWVTGDAVPSYWRGAKKKAGGSSRNGRDSIAKRLGVKAGDGVFVRIGQVLVRQRGTRWLPGERVGVGRDDTIYALADGRVRFTRNREKRAVVNVEPLVEQVSSSSSDAGRIRQEGLQALSVDAQ